MPEETTETTETTQTPVEGGVRQTQTVKQDSTARSSTQLELLIYWLVGVIEALLALRVVLSLLGANKTNGFANLIYSLTYPLVAPFFGLFGYTVNYGVSHFEIETVVAMVVYGLVGYGIGRLFRLGRV